MQNSAGTRTSPSALRGQWLNQGMLHVKNTTTTINIIIDHVYISIYKHKCVSTAEMIVLNS